MDINQKKESMFEILETRMSGIVSAIIISFVMVNAIENISHKAG